MTRFYCGFHGNFEELQVLNEEQAGAIPVSYVRLALQGAEMKPMPTIVPLGTDGAWVTSVLDGPAMVVMFS